MQIYDKIQKTPFRGASHTVSVIRDAALAAQERFEVRELAEEICRELRSKDYLSEAIAIYHFVCANTRYMRDPKTIELVKDPAKVCQEILSGQRPQLDCDDLTALLVALLLMTGANVRIVTVAFSDIRYKGERQYSHVFVQVFEPKSKKYVTLDPVAGDRTKEMHNKIRFAKVYSI